MSTEPGQGCSSLDASCGSRMKVGCWKTTARCGHLRRGEQVDTQKLVSVVGDPQAGDFAGLEQLGWMWQPLTRSWGSHRG